MKKRLHSAAAVLLSAVMIAGCGEAAATGEANAAAEETGITAETMSFETQEVSAEHEEGSLTGYWRCTGVQQGDDAMVTEVIGSIALGDIFYMNIYDTDRMVVTSDHRLLADALAGEEAGTQTQLSGEDAKNIQEDGKEGAEDEDEYSEDEYSEDEDSEDEDSEDEDEDEEETEEETESTKVDITDMTGEKVSDDQEVYLTWKKRGSSYQLYLLAQDDDSDDDYDDYDDEDGGDSEDEASEPVYGTLNFDGENLILTIEDTAPILPEMPESEAAGTEEDEEDADESETVTYSKDDSLSLEESDSDEEEETQEEETVTISWTFEYAGAPQGSVLAFAPSLSSDDTIAMSNFMNFNMYLDGDGQEIYGRSFALGMEYLSRLTYSEDEEGNYVLEDIDHLYESDDCAYYLCRYEDLIYYCLGGSIWCLDPATDEITELYAEGGASYLQVYEDQLYFTAGDMGHFYRMNMDGTGMQEVIAKQVYYPYVLENGWIIFQDEEDNESIHVMDMATGYDGQLIKGPVYRPIISGDYLYALKRMDNEWETYCMCRLDLNTFELEISDEEVSHAYFFIRDDELAFRGGTRVSGLEYWDAIYSYGDEDTEEEIVYVSKDYYVGAEVNALNQYTSMHFYNADEELEGFDLIVQ